MKSLLNSQINYKFTYCFALSLLINPFFREFTFVSPKSLWIHYLFREFTINSLSFWNRPIRLFFTKLNPRLTSDDFLWPDWTSNNFEFQSSTKYWVETYVYLIYFAHPARFDSYWTSLTQVWPPMTLIELLKNIKSEFLRKFWVESYVYLIYFDQPARFDPNSTIWPKFDLWWP